MSVEVVKAVKAELEARGVNLSGPCGAFAIASRVAWRLRDTGIGLHHQDAGRTHCAFQGGTYSPDFLVYPDGRGVDVLGDGGGANNPQWAEKPGDATRWRAPGNPDAGAPETPQPTPTPVPAPSPCLYQPVDLGAILEELTALREDLATTDAKVQFLISRPVPVVTFPPYRGGVNFRGSIVLNPDK